VNASFLEPDADGQKRVAKLAPASNDSSVKPDGDSEPAAACGLIDPRKLVRGNADPIPNTIQLPPTNLSHAVLPIISASQRILVPNASKSSSVGGVLQPRALSRRWITATDL
jgi:hypothetical protein